MPAITIRIKLEPTLNNLEVWKSLASNLNVLAFSLDGDNIALTTKARKNEIAIWCINGSINDSCVFATYSFMTTPATKATSEPHNTDLEVEFLKNIAERKTNKITGLNNPIYSCTYWKAESKLPRKIGATNMDIAKPSKPIFLPTPTN